MTRVLRKSSRGIDFMELLLDERVCAGTIKIPCEMMRSVGGINHKLPAKQKYELLLRIANEMQVELVEDDNAIEDCMILSDDEGCSEDGWRVDCYVAGKYSEKIKEKGYFEAVVDALLNEAEYAGRYEETLQYLEEMIGRTENFYQMDDATRPILIYKGDEVCYNVLTVFAEQLGEALERAGELVEYFDVAKEDWQEIIRYKGKRFKAVIGIQTYLFTVKMKDGVHYLHEYIYGPKFNFIFDHPVWMKKHLTHDVPDFTVLTHDSNYVAFVEKYYHKPAILFPPAGMNGMENSEEREYDVTFVGTYGDYMNQVLALHGMEREKRFLGNRLLLVLRKNPEMTLEDALTRVLEERNMDLEEGAFLELLYELRTVSYCVAQYYRSKVIRTILESGIQLDVFGNSWMNSPFIKYPNLVCHPDVTVEESLLIYSKSRLSLNIMTWHKAGFTERMASIMLAGAVLVTDDTKYLNQKTRQEDMLVFSLQELWDLPKKMKQVLSDEVFRKEIAQSGKQWAQEEHTWDVRARQFMDIVDKKKKKIAFIICISDMVEFAECKYYLDRLEVPEGYEKDIVTIQGAPSMTAGYNAGMQSSDAEYKVYIHQDVFILNKNFIQDMLDVFAQDEKIGLLGCIGVKHLDEYARAVAGWDAGKVLHNCTPTVLEFPDDDKKYQKVEAVDGLLIATRYDIPWREDIFDGWDFYDISQCMEVKRKGLYCVVPKQIEPWCYHDNSYSKMQNYYKYLEKFAQEYSDIREFRPVPPTAETQEMALVKEESRHELAGLVNAGGHEQLCQLFRNASNRGYLHLKEFETLADIEQLEQQNMIDDTKRIWKSGMELEEILWCVRQLKFLLKRIEFESDEREQTIERMVDAYSVCAIMAVFVQYTVDKKNVYEWICGYYRNHNMVADLEKWKVLERII